MNWWEQIGILFLAGNLAKGVEIFKMFILFDSLSQRLGIFPEEIIRDIKKLLLIF